MKNMNKINPFATNILKMLRQEMMIQLVEKGDPELDILNKQLQLKETIDDVINIAKNSPNGEVSVVFLNPGTTKRMTALELLRHNKIKVTFFNTTQLEGYLTKTIIFVPFDWSNKFRIFRCSLNLTDEYLKEDTNE